MSCIFMIEISLSSTWNTFQSALLLCDLILCKWRTCFESINQFQIALAYSGRSSNGIDHVAQIPLARYACRFSDNNVGNGNAHCKKYIHASCAFALVKHREHCKRRLFARGHFKCATCARECGHCEFKLRWRAFSHNAMGRHAPIAANLARAKRCA